MDRIIDGVLKFQQEIFPQQKALFEELSNVQHPQALFIGCSDSRVVPEMFTQQGPGDLFVVRNAGNIVPPYGVAAGGVSASIEYAVAVLGVPDVVICGHSGCGAMRAIQSGGPQLEALPAVAKWLNFSNSAQSVVEKRFAAEDAATKLHMLVRENVVVQLDNLLTHPAVAHAVGAKQLRLHGWIFEIATGGVEVYDAEARKFIALDRASAAGSK